MLPDFPTLCFQTSPAPASLSDMSEEVVLDERPDRSVPTIPWIHRQNGFHKADGVIGGMDDDPGNCPAEEEVLGARNLSSAPKTAAVPSTLSGPPSTPSGL